jgi:hypothetical protein
MPGMTKPILVVTSRYPKEVEDRIDRDFSARRNPNQFPFSQQGLLSAAEEPPPCLSRPQTGWTLSFSRRFRPL